MMLDAWRNLLRSTPRETRQRTRRALQESVCRDLRPVWRSDT